MSMFISDWVGLQPTYFNATANVIILIITTRILTVSITFRCLKYWDLGRLSAK